jgi:hypothetical protein
VREIRDTLALLDVAAMATTPGAVLCLDGVTVKQRGLADLASDLSLGSYQPLDSDLTSLAALDATVGDAGKVIVGNGSHAYTLGQDMRTSASPQFAGL